MITLDELRAAAEKGAKLRPAQVASAAMRLAESAQALELAGLGLLSLVEHDNTGEIATAVAHWRPLRAHFLRSLPGEHARQAASCWEEAVHRWEVALQLFKWETSFGTQPG